MSAKLSLSIYLHGGVFNISVDGKTLNRGSDGIIGTSIVGGKNFRFESVLNGISSHLNLSTGVIETTDKLAKVDPNDPENSSICTSSENIIAGQCSVTRTSPDISIFYIKSDVDGNYLYFEENGFGFIKAIDSQSKPLSDVKKAWFYVQKMGDDQYTIMSAKTNKYVGIVQDMLLSNGTKSIFNFIQVYPPEKQSVIDSFNSKVSTNNFDVCCDMIQPASYTDDYAACSYAGFYFDNNRYSKNCKGYMMNRCSSNSIDNYLCKDFCNNSDEGINCDSITQRYCDSLGEEALNKDVCNCFWPSQYLDNYYSSLKNRFPQVEFKRDVMCSHVKCSQLRSGAINAYSYKKNPQCPDIKMCVNNINFTNEGTIKTDSINFNQVAKCFGESTSSSPLPQPSDVPSHVDVPTNKIGGIDKGILIIGGIVFFICIFFLLVLVLII